MLADIQPSDGLFINCENNFISSEFVTTITAGISKRNKTYVMENAINTTGTNARTITTQYGKKGWSAMLDSDRDSLTCVQNSETYRIRKLTPRECFRLMGVSETEIDTIQAANLSDTPIFPCRE